MIADLLKNIRSERLKFMSNNHGKLPDVVKINPYDIFSITVDSVMKNRSPNPDNLMGMKIEIDRNVRNGMCEII